MIAEEGLFNIVFIDLCCCPKFEGIQALIKKQLEAGYDLKVGFSASL